MKATYKETDFQRLYFGDSFGFKIDVCFSEN